MAAGIICLSMAGAEASDVVVKTSAYSWHGDTVSQGPFKAYAASPQEIISDYSAQPGFYMGIDKIWRLKNDISGYPRLTTPNLLHEAVYNMGLDEMVNAVEPDTTLRTGKEWAGVWTRDVSYSILLSMAYMQPEASMISLMKKVDPLGRIIQDTGSGGAWPVSTDREIWGIAAWEVYKVTGDRKWLEFIYPVIRRSLETDAKAIYGTETGLVRGETSFIDWREQSHPRWMQCADIYQSQTLSTSIVHYEAWRVLSEIASILGDKDVAGKAAQEAARIKDAVNKYLWIPEKGYYAMYLYGRDNLIVNPRAETLGESLAIMWDVADASRAQSITENNPVTPFGAAIFYPQIPDMPAYHNNALWPWVGAWWAMANAKAGNEEGVMEAIGAIVRPAALFATNKENFNLDNGDYFTELNSSNMLWSLSGNLALTNRILFGIHFEKDGLLIKPFVPQALAGQRSLDNFPYRGGRLNITVDGYGANVKSLTVNGKSYPADKVIPADVLKNGANISVVMDSRPIPEMKVNNVANLKAPLTPMAWLDNDGTAADGKPLMNELRWNPIEYIGEYIVLRDGREVGRTHTTSWPAAEEGEWQVIGVAGDGTQGFASEPRSNRARAAVQPGAEKTVMSSKEVSYPAKDGVKGYHGAGFAELDHGSAPLEFPIDLDEGVYTIAFRYANGNGPVNTENKCSVRSLFVDGVEAGTVVMPQRGVGNWDDWGMSNTVRISVPAGRHVVKLEYDSDDENMNLATNHALVDEMVVERVSDSSEK